MKACLGFSIRHLEFEDDSNLDLSSAFMLLFSLPAAAALRDSSSLLLFGWFKVMVHSLQSFPVALGLVLLILLFPLP